MGVKSHMEFLAQVILSLRSIMYAMCTDLVGPWLFLSNHTDYRISLAKLQDDNELSDQELPEYRSLISDSKT